MVLEPRTITIDMLGNVTSADDGDQAWADDFLRALGYLVVQSNMLEYALQDLYWIVTGKTREEVEEEVRGKPLGTLRNLALNAFERRFPTGEHRERLEVLRPELEQAVNARNHFIHAEWSFGTTVMHRRRLPRERGAAVEHRQMTAADVEAAIETVGGTAERVWSELYDPVELATRST